MADREDEAFNPILLPKGRAMLENIQRLGDLGVGICKCGHLEQHHSQIPFKALQAIDQHGGGCLAGTCACNRYTFVRWATLEEAAGLSHIATASLQSCTASCHV